MHVPAPWPHLPGPVVGEDGGLNGPLFLTPNSNIPTIFTVFPVLPPSPGQCYLGSIRHEVQVLFRALPFRVAHINVLSSVINTLVIAARKASMSFGYTQPCPFPPSNAHYTATWYLIFHHPGRREERLGSHIEEGVKNAEVGVRAGVARLF